MYLVLWCSGTRIICQKTCPHKQKHTRLLILFYSLFFFKANSKRALTRIRIGLTSLHITHLKFAPKASTHPSKQNVPPTWSLVLKPVPDLSRPGWQQHRRAGKRRRWPGQWRSANQSTAPTATMGTGKGQLESVTHTHTHTHTVTHTHTHTHTHTQSYTHTHTHTVIHSHSLSFTDPYYSFIFKYELELKNLILQGL